MPRMAEVEGEMAEAGEVMEEVEVEGVIPEAAPAMAEEVEVPEARVVAAAIVRQPQETAEVPRELQAVKDAAVVIAAVREQLVEKVAEAVEVSFHHLLNYRHHRARRHRHVR